MNSNLKLRLSKYKFKGDLIYIEYIYKDIIQIKIKMKEEKIKELKVRKLEKELENLDENLD